MTAHAAGIDLGGTKIEAHVYDAEWNKSAQRRMPTPAGEYAELLEALADQIEWCRQNASQGAPIGIAVPGYVDSTTGLAVTANLAATGHPFLNDLRTLAGGRIVQVNDASAFTLSEAVFGAGRGFDTVLGLIIGTGVGGDVAVDGKIPDRPGHLSGEFGHLPLPASFATAHGLPILRCGCGRLGCFETLLSGPGLSRLSRHMTRQALTPDEIVAEAQKGDPEQAEVWSRWCGIAGELLAILQATLSPDCVVMGGGLSRIDGVAADLTRKLHKGIFPGLTMPKIVVADGSDTSGARGAAYAAVLS